MCKNNLNHLFENNLTFVTKTVLLPLLPETFFKFFRNKGGRKKCILKTSEFILSEQFFFFCMRDRTCAY